MLFRAIIGIVLAVVLAAPAGAFTRGSLFIENAAHAPSIAQFTPTYDLWLHQPEWEYAVATGINALIHKPVPFSGPGRFLMPSQHQVIFHDQRIVSFWDGIPRRYNDPAPAYVNIFAAETELGEIAPLRSGNFLVPERWNDRARGAKLIEFNLRGVVAEYPFPQLVDPVTDRAVGAAFIELLDDHCTVLYTLGDDHPQRNRVLRMNLCTGQPLPDFATLVSNDYAGSIRQLPNGDVLVANSTSILRFNRSGSLLMTYSFSGVTHLALTPDGTSFWASGLDGSEIQLRRFDVAKPWVVHPRVRLGNPEMQTLLVPLATTDLVMVGEWRAAGPAPRSRVTRR